MRGIASGDKIHIDFLSSLKCCSNFQLLFSVLQFSVLVHYSTLVRINLVKNNVAFSSLRARYLLQELVETENRAERIMNIKQCLPGDSNLTLNDCYCCTISVRFVTE